MEDERLAIRKIVIDSRTATAGTGSNFQVQLPETVRCRNTMAATSQIFSALILGELYMATHLWVPKTTISTSLNA